MINPNYIKLIERIKEKYPELKELVEDLKLGTIISIDSEYPYTLWKYIENWFGEDNFWFLNLKNELSRSILDFKIIWKLDLYILSKALHWYAIQYWVIHKLIDANWPMLWLWNIIKLPNGNIETYPDELLEKLYQLI